MYGQRTSCTMEKKRGRKRESERERDDRRGVEGCTWCGIDGDVRNGGGGEEEWVLMKKRCC